MRLRFKNCPSRRWSSTMRIFTGGAARAGGARWCRCNSFSIAPGWRARPNSLNFFCASRDISGDAWSALARARRTFFRAQSRSHRRYRDRPAANHARRFEADDSCDRPQHRPRSRLEALAPRCRRHRDHLRPRAVDARCARGAAVAAARLTSVARFRMTPRRISLTLAGAVETLDCDGFVRLLLRR